MWAALICLQVERWMSRAEEIKSYLAVQSLGTTTTDLSRQEEEDTQSNVMSMSVLLFLSPCTLFL